MTAFHLINLQLTAFYLRKDVRIGFLSTLTNTMHLENVCLGSRHLCLTAEQSSGLNSNPNSPNVNRVLGRTFPYTDRVIRISEISKNEEAHIVQLELMELREHICIS